MLIFTAVFGLVSMLVLMHYSEFLSKFLLAWSGAENPQGNNKIQMRGMVEKLITSLHVIVLGLPVVTTLWWFRTNDTLEQIQKTKESTDVNILFGAQKMMFEDIGKVPGPKTLFGFEQLMHLHQQGSYRATIDLIIRDANLAGLNLSSISMCEADLSSAILEKSLLVRADLRNAILFRANLINAKLLMADLQNANMTYADLQRAYLRAANLQGANMKRADLQRASLRNAKLQGASMEHADLQNANLQEAHLQGANMGHADLQNADLQQAQLQGANLENATFSNAKFKGSKYSDETKLPMALNPAIEGMVKVP